MIRAPRRTPSATTNAGRSGRWLVALGLALALGGCPGDGDDDTADDDTADDDSIADDDTATDDDDADDDSAGDDDDDDDSDPLPPAWMIPCVDPVDAVYVTPPNLPPWDETVLGDIVRCAPGDVLSAGEVHDRLLDAGVADVVPVSGAADFRVAYRTTRWAGQGGIGSARVWLPIDPPADGPLPIVIAAHGTAGLADHCAPSRFERSSDALTLPFVGLGFAVIAPDYAGLGTDGVQGYGDPVDTAYSVLDAARALRAHVTPGTLATGAIAVGHSQGGGAALAAHALAPDYAADPLLAAIPFAPGWTTDTEALWWASHYPEQVPWEGTQAATTTMALYADAANHLGPPHEYDYFDPALAEEIAGLLDDECIVGLSTHVHPLAPSLAGALDLGFVAGVAACLDGQPACAEPADGYVQRYQAGLLDVDPDGGPILFVQGLADDLATPERAACIVEALTDDGVAPQLCIDEDAEHLDVAERGVGFAVTWATALARGEALPACDPVPLPGCE